MSLTKEIEIRIEKFVAEMNDLVRKQALEAVASALGSGAPVKRGPGRPPKSASNGAVAAIAAPKAARGKARRKGEKRTPEELLQLETSLADFVRANPGQGIEAIGKALAQPTGELSRPMKKLVQRGEVRTEGEKRATKYFPGDGTPAAAEAESRPRGRKGAKKKSKKR